MHGYWRQAWLRDRQACGHQIITKSLSRAVPKQRALQKHCAGAVRWTMGVVVREAVSQRTRCSLHWCGTGLASRFPCSCAWLATMVVLPASLLTCVHGLL